MFDTMTMTKVVGGLCGTLLVYLLGGWVAETIYHGGGGHSEAQAYVIEVADGGGEAEVVEEVDFAVVMASASAADGEGVWRNCRSCHALEPGVNGTGPTLYGVVGRPVDAVAGFAYSGALEEVVDVWTPDALNGFLENPKGYAPGTIMGFNGLRKVEDRANLIAYLDSLDD
ncbi:c-type cytochrome [Yoonia sp.]|uniref:c-type cytochrome n=1 Tax=Yoonia sp. TaxID=2212373 RepID=UPI0025E44858|nr:c-type cytochrome [Yoonia sp.]